MSNTSAHEQSKIHHFWYEISQKSDKIRIYARDNMTSAQLLLYVLVISLREGDGPRHISVSRFGSSCSPWLEPVGFFVYCTILDNLVFWVGSEKCPENGVLIFSDSLCKIQGILNATIFFGHNFWQEGPTDLSPTPLSEIFHALFRDTQLGYVQYS